MTWYYAESGQQKGPVSDWDFSGLVRNGTIQPETLVWNENMTEWQPVLKVRPDLVAGPGAATIAGYAVPGQKKDLVVQQMREGVLPADLSMGLHMGPVYVGFWWRLLAWFIDWLVRTIASCVAVIPIILLAAAATAGSHSATPGPPNAMNVLGQFATTAMGLVVSGFYYTWLTGKYGATLGKMALGFKVVTADGGKVSYARALGRWAAEYLLGQVILLTVMALFVTVAFLLAGGSQLFTPVHSSKLSSAFPVKLFIGVGLAVILGALAGSFPWWMAGLDPEKRTLHDRICATRVIRK